MHSLIGTYIKNGPPEVDLEGDKIWPVKVIFPPGIKFRVLYFKSERLQIEW